MRALAAVAAVALAVPVLSCGAGAGAQDDPVAWARTAARGIFEICLQDAPDAGRVVDHAEVWGWPPFEGYLEHPEGFKRQAGGESRRDFQQDDKAAYVEATVQSGTVTAASPALVRYFRCDVDSDQPVDADLAEYFAGLYGAPTSRDGEATVWLAGGPAGQGATEGAALQAVAGAGDGAKRERIELSRENGRDHADLIMFLNGPAD